LSVPVKAYAQAPDKTPLSFLCVGEGLREVVTALCQKGCSDAPLLIHGSTGTGKDLVARAGRQRQRATPGAVSAGEPGCHPLGAGWGSPAARC